MKKKIGFILTSISVAIILTYFLVINISFDKTPILVDINGNREALGDISLNVTKDMDRYTGGAFTIAKDDVIKEGTYHSYEMMFNENVKDDKKFYRNNRSYGHEIYEGDNSRFSASLEYITFDDRESYINIRYRDKNTNKYSSFQIETPNISHILGVYSDGKNNKIVAEANPKVWNCDIAILDVNVENETFTVAQEITIKDTFKTKDVAMLTNINGGSNSNSQSMVSDGNMYLLMTQKNGWGLGVVSINIFDGTITEYPHGFIYANIPSIYDNVAYFTIVNDTTQTIDIISFNIEDNSFKEYRDLKFDSEIGESWNNGSATNVRIVNDILYLGYYHGGKGFRNFINVVDLNTNKSLYLGEFTNSYLRDIKL